MKKIIDQIKNSKIVVKNINELMPYAKNSRKHSDFQINKIKKSISEFGFTNPILIDQDGGIIAGHARVLAAMALNLEEVPCIELGHLTNLQKKAYIIADNQLALISDWDVDFLRDEILELKNENYEIDLLGFDKNLFDDHEKESKDNSKELDAKDFQEFDHKCPKCGHEYDS